MIRAKKILAFIFILAGVCDLEGFSQVSVSRANVFTLDSNLVVTESLGRVLLKYKFILIGEMHGTKEAVSFMVEVVKALSKNQKVLAGFEIPSDEISLKTKKIRSRALKKSDFFMKNSDGRSSTAAFKAILDLSKMKNVDLVFFDVTGAKNAVERDSAMFLNIQKEFKKDTNCVVVAISGNIHNQLKPYQGNKTLGYLIKTFLSPSVLSVNHVYESGTMYNNTGNGSSLRKVDGTQTVLKSISITPDYFYLDLNNEFSRSWNSFLFTTKINASYPVKND